MLQAIIIKLHDTFEFSKKYYWQILIFTLPILVSFNILESIIPAVFPDENLSSFLMLVLGFCYNGIFYTVLIYITDRLYKNKSISVDDIKEFIIKNFLPVTASLLAILFVSIAGLFLLIIPGIIMYSRLAITPYLLCLDEQKFQNSFNTSFQHSKPYTWIIFISSLIISLPEVILTLGQFSSSQFLPSWIIIIFSYVISIFHIILLYYFYVDIKGHIGMKYSP